MNDKSKVLTMSDLRHTVDCLRTVRVPYFYEEFKPILIFRSFRPLEWRVIGTSGEAVTCARYIPRFED